MRKLKVIIVAVLSLCLIASFVYAQEKGTKAEAKALLKKAVALIKAEGPDKAFPQLQDPNGKYVMKDLYVYVVTIDGRIVKVHPKMPAMIGKSWPNMKDADGKDFGTDLYEGALKNGSGSVDYKWVNPSTKKIESKAAFYERVGGNIVVSGYYK
jgi:cytochrome c